MAKEVTENKLLFDLKDQKEPLFSSNNDEIEKKDNFRVPLNNFVYKTKKSVKRLRKNKLSGKTYHHKVYKGTNKRILYPKKILSYEVESDKNIAILLKSERLQEDIKKGNRIPYKIAWNICQKTGFKTVRDFNTYISSRRKQFIVLMDKKEKYCQSEASNCNTFRRFESVDLNLYFQHHYGISPKTSTI